MSLMAGPSQAGEWTAVVGVPEFGFDAALAFGVDLGRCIVVPEPGEHWLSVTAGLVEVTSLVLVRPPVAVSEQQAARMLARLRQKDAALLVDTGQLGDRAWPRPQRRLSVTDNRWSGLGRGHGHLQSRRVTVRSRGGGVPDRTVDLWLPDQRLDVRVETGGTRVRTGRPDGARSGTARARTGVRWPPDERAGCPARPVGRRGGQERPPDADSSAADSSVSRPPRG